MLRLNKKYIECVFDEHIKLPDVYDEYDEMLFELWCEIAEEYDDEIK